MWESLRASRGPSLRIPYNLCLAGRPGRMRSNAQKVDQKDLTAQIRGFRGWELGFDGTAFLLISSHETKWTPKEPQKAKCMRFYSEKHESPDVRCTCGLYGVREARNCQGSLLGAVEMWGRYVEHEVGWRSQFAYPVALSAVRCQTCKQVSSFSKTKYSVSVTSSKSPKIRISCDDCRTNCDDNIKWLPSSHAIEQIEYLYGLEVS